MRILEEDYGIQLMIRLPRGIELTQAGQTLLQQAEIWFNQESQLRQTLNANQQLSHNQLKLGVMECLGNQLATKMQLSLESILGDHRFDLKVGNTQSLLEQLEAGDLDVIVAFNVQESKQFRIHQQYHCPIGLVYPTHLSVKEESEISLSDCLEWPLCLADDELSFQPRVYAEIMRQKKAHKISATSNSVNVLKQWVKSGRGVTFLTEFDVAAERINQELGFKPLKEKRLSENLCICTATNTHTSQTMPLIVSALEHALTSHAHYLTSS